MPEITPEFINEQLTQRFPLLAENLPSLQKLVNKCEFYRHEVGRTPSLEDAARWAQSLENDLQAEAAQARAQQPEPPPEPPAKVWTDAEVSRMSSEDMVRNGVVSRNKRVDEMQGNTSRAELRPERAGTRKVRTIKFSQEELAAQEYRQRVIAQDKAERKRLWENAERERVKQDLKRAMEAAQKHDKR